MPAFVRSRLLTERARCTESEIAAGKAPSRQFSGASMHGTHAKCWSQVQKLHREISRYRRPSVVKRTFSPLAGLLGLIAGQDFVEKSELSCFTTPLRTTTSRRCQLTASVSVALRCGAQRSKAHAADARQTQNLYLLLLNIICSFEEHLRKSLAGLRGQKSDSEGSVLLRLFVASEFRLFEALTSGARSKTSRRDRRLRRVLKLPCRRALRLWTFGSLKTPPKANWEELQSAQLLVCDAIPQVWQLVGGDGQPSSSESSEDARPHV